MKKLRQEEVKHLSAGQALSISGFESTISDSHMDTWLPSREERGGERMNLNLLHQSSTMSD